jgi:hypothetical protein
MKRFASCVGARALATIRKGIRDLGRVFEVPVGRIPEFCIVFGVSLHQRGRPTPARDIISIHQRLKSGTEFDQFGIRGLRGRSLTGRVDRIWCSDRRSGGCGRGSGCARGNGQEVSPRRIDGRVCGWRAMHAVSLGHWITVLCGSG